MSEVPPWTSQWYEPINFLFSLSQSELDFFQWQLKVLTNALPQGSSQNQMKQHVQSPSRQLVRNRNSLNISHLHNKTRQGKMPVDTRLRIRERCNTNRVKALRSGEGKRSKHGQKAWSELQKGQLFLGSSEKKPWEIKAKAGGSLKDFMSVASFPWG